MTSALQAVILDFDGVIADSEPLHLRAFQDALREEGLELSASEYYTRYLGYDDVGLMQALARDRGIPMSDQRLTALVARKGLKIQEMLHNGVLFPGAADFIRIAAARVPLAIASGAMNHEIRAILDVAGLSSLFTVIVAAGDTSESKPSPAPYLLAVEQLRQAYDLDLKAARCVAVEDSRWGLESARGAGLRCVGVTTTYRAEELPADLVVGSLAELTMDALDRLCAREMRKVDA